jgi:hypothetical protein
VIWPFATGPWDSHMTFFAMCDSALLEIFSSS